jgi:hypothetical protein
MALRRRRRQTPAPALLAALGGAFAGNTRPRLGWLHPDRRLTQPAHA